MSMATLSGEHSDISGERFGRLVATTRAPILMANRKTMSLWVCACDCGLTVTVRLSNLRSGNTRSCGCLYKEAMLAKRRTKALYPGEYIVWCGMRWRCNNPSNGSFADYGGRGIKVCDSWNLSFEAFISDVGRRPHPALQLDRIDVNGNYEPENVRWATASQQAKNKRNTVRVRANGIRLAVCDWCEKLGVDKALVEQRVRLGWDPLDALIAPKNAKNPGRDLRRKKPAMQSASR